MGEAQWRGSWGTRSRGDALGLTQLLAGGEESRHPKNSAGRPGDREEAGAAAKSPTAHRFVLLV